MVLGKSRGGLRNLFQIPEQPATRYQLPATSERDRYECENSLEENARKVLGALWKH
jgi:hypothetical protein